jgi:repressor LexA
MPHRLSKFNVQKPSMPYPDLTATQKRVYRFIEEWTQNRGFPPTVRELAKGLKYKSLNSVRQHLRLIQKKNHLDIEPGKARGIGLRRPHGNVPTGTWKTVSLVGNVAAGTPITAEENVEGAVTLDPEIFKGENLFALRVRGDSMKDIGVYDGDIAVMKRESGADDGEVVAAVIEGEATLKRIFKKRDRIILHAENPLFPDIVVHASEKVFIAGRLVGIIRKY